MELYAILYSFLYLNRIGVVNKKMKILVRTPEDPDSNHCIAVLGNPDNMIGNVISCLITFKI
jgi:hypothetical protein